MLEDLSQQAEARELLSFQILYTQRKIWATWGLALVIAIMFLLEELFGGSTNVAVLVRMGANVSELVQAGEYWRLLTCVFLHAGFMHVFVNTYVLFALGGFFNRIFGDSVYLTIFFVSGITGSLMSTFLGHSQVSVGASGAIWGLFGASIAIAFFKTHLIPEAVRLRLRRVTLINLAINVGVSFLPMVDMWAHFGGGIGGFLVSLLIIAGPRTPNFGLLKARFFQVLAILLGLAYVVSITEGMIKSKPWVDQLSAPLQAVALSSVPFSISMPEGLALTTGADNQANSAHFVFGNLKFDQVAVELHFFHESAIGEPLDEAWLASQRSHLLSDQSFAANVKKTVDLRHDPQGGHVFYQQFPRNDVVIYNYLLLRNNYVIKLSFVVSATVKQMAIEALARRVIGSLKPLSS